ncbi:MAG: hypothetical protein E4G74_04300 [Erysipelotrichales bacterium]|nr:MAG: hypothetical protein E4G74_04300 [Erysipelotrichales bacterium]
MKNVRILRIVGMFAMFALFIFYLYLRSTSTMDVAQLQFLILFVGSLITLVLSVVIYILDKQHRKSLTIAILLILLVAFLSLFIR